MYEVILMRIMLVNDDGIAAPGIWALYDALAGEHDVMVCAPHNQCSGFSHSISITGRLKARRYRRGGAQAYEIFGTPADCALLGLEALCECPPDMVISGINDGYNSAADVHYSGTIGAAFEACMHGVPALAVSTQLGNREFGPTVQLTRRLIDIALKEAHRDCILSLNVPAGEVRGLRRAPLAWRYDDSAYVRREARGDDIEFDVTHKYCAPDALEPRYDRELLARGFATYTALLCDWTA